jgi:hypothetical protein
MKLVEGALPSDLDLDARQEARAALLCDLLSGRLSQRRLRGSTVRHYINLARVSRYADVRLDAVLPGGSSSRLEFMVG